MKEYHHWKEMLQEEPLYGCFVTYGLPDLAEYTAMLGFDFLLIDNEHGVIEQKTMIDMIRASQCSGVPAIVRCTENTYTNVQKALDMGADGVQLTLVNTADDARQAVALSNYPPEGKRGVAFLPRASAYGLVEDKKTYMREANASKLVSCQIETKEALNNLNEILAVDGVDVFFIGPGDLSVSLGMSSNDKEFQDIVRQTIEKIVKAGRIAGYYVGNADAAKQAAEWGARFLVTAITPYMTAGGRSFLKAVRGEEGEEGIRDIY